MRLMFDLLKIAVTSEELVEPPYPSDPVIVYNYLPTRQRHGDQLYGCTVYSIESTSISKMSSELGMICEKE